MITTTRDLTLDLTLDSARKHTGVAPSRFAPKMRMQTRAEGRLPTENRVLRAAKQRAILTTHRAQSKAQDAAPMGPGGEKR